MVVEAKHKFSRRATISHHRLLHQHHRQRKSAARIETLIATAVSPDVALAAKVAKITGSDGGESADRGSVEEEDDFVKTRGRRGRESQIKGSVHSLHPGGPLNSHPPRNDEGDDGSTRRATTAATTTTTSFTADMQAIIIEIRGSLINRIRRADVVLEDEAAGGRPPRSLTPALVANLATEFSSRDNELMALKGEKWVLQRKVMS